MEYKLMEPETELKPCPFCGSDGAVVRMGVSYFVMCETCTCCRVKGYGSEAAAIEAWNTRVNDCRECVYAVAHAPQEEDK